MKRLTSLALALALALALTLAFTTVIHAQDVRRTQISGIVQDAEAVALQSSTVMLLNAGDSVLVSFAATSTDGAFVLKNVSPGEYLLRVSYLGYKTETIPLTIGAAAEVTLEAITLVIAPEILTEVQVTAEHIPIQMKNDTIEYNADAFQTQPSAVVEDLLKRLPGVEVEGDGTIKAQGETVRNVLVDGKEFFGSDPKIATRNLPARAVRKVQVYDQQSRMAEFSGVDDGERERTINLELREEFKTGLFGTAEAGYGSDDRYIAKTNINRFTKRSQLSLLGLFNNVNEQGFSFDDYINFSGGARSFMRGGAMQVRGGRDTDIPLSGGVSNGLTNTLAGGINYNFDIGKKFKLRSSYFYNGVKNDLLQNAFRQNFSNLGTYHTFDEKEQETQNQSHRLTLRTEFQIDSTQEIELRSNASIGSGDLESLQFQHSFTGENLLRNYGETSLISNTDRTTISGDLYYRKKFGNDGRTATGNISLNTGDNTSVSRLMAINEYLETGNTDLLDQLQSQISDNMRWSGRLSYTEPIARRQFLEFRYAYENDMVKSRRDVNDVDSLGFETWNPDLSTRFRRDVSTHRTGLTYRINTQKSNFNFGVEYEDAGMEGRINEQETPVTKQFRNVLPSVRWRYQMATARSLRFDYSTSVNLPSVEQLSPIVDNSDPLRLYVGNPDLRAEYRHRASVHFNAFSQFSGTSIFAMINSTLTKNKIVNATTISPELIETRSPLNVDNDYQVSGFASFGTPLRFIGTRAQVNTNMSYNRSSLPINTVFNDLDRWTRRAGLELSSLNHDVYEYRLGANWTQTTTTYSENKNLGQDFFTHNYFAEITLNFLKSWSFNTSFDYRLYTGDQFDRNQSLSLWRASLSKYVMEGRRGQFRLSVFDVLDENKGLSRTSSANYIEEITANSVGRYVLLSFLYSIRGFGQESSPFPRFRPIR